MAPLLPRMHLFEIDDQSWFPAFLRTRVQDALTLVWNTSFPILIPSSPAQICAKHLVDEFGSETLSSSVCIDFCAGAGGPTPSIAKYVNDNAVKPVDFILTDIHPNVAAWERLSEKRPRISYEKSSVDASDAPTKLTTRDDGKDVIRLFNLAFHHFDDHLAGKILKNTVETSQGFAIFELQDRYISSFLNICLLPFAVMLLSPYFAWKWRSPAVWFFCWVVPILPFVLFFDGWMSSLRTRTPSEVEQLLRGCGADTSEWELKSGNKVFLPPFGYVNWVIGKPIRNKPTYAEALKEE